MTVVPNRDARSATGECPDCHLIVASSQLAAHQGSKKCMEEAEKRRKEDATPRICTKCGLELETNWRNRQKHIDACNGKAKAKKRPASGPIGGTQRPAPPQRKLGSFFAAKPPVATPPPPPTGPALVVIAPPRAPPTAAEDAPALGENDDALALGENDDADMLQAAIDLSLEVRLSVFAIALCLCSVLKKQPRACAGSEQRQRPRLRFNQCVPRRRFSSFDDACRLGSRPYPGILRIG